jgi:L-iditol 2-dehydrogenase
VKATELVGVREMAETSVPDPAPERDQVVVRPEAVGICGSDLSAFQGHHPRMVPPLVLGHEFAGEIVEVGLGASNDLIGRRVGVDPVVSCGVCQACLDGRRNICHFYRTLGCRPGLPGAFAEMVVVDADKTWELPDGCSYLSGALIQPLAVGHHAVVDRAGVVSGDEVLILGAGPVGLGALMLALAEGAKATVVDIDPYRLEIARGMGAHRTLTADEAASIASEYAQTRPRIVLECAGGTQSSTLATATAWCRPGGRIVIVGNFAEGVDGVDPVAIKVKELDVLGSQAYSDSYGPLLEMIRSNRIDPGAMVSHILPLDNPSVGLELLDDSGVDTAKVVMTAQNHAVAESAGLLP